MSMQTCQNSMIIFKTFGLKPYRTSASNKIYTQLQIVKFIPQLYLKYHFLNLIMITYQGIILIAYRHFYTSLLRVL